MYRKCSQHSFCGSDSASERKFFIICLQQQQISTHTSTHEFHVHQCSNCRELCEVVNSSTQEKYRNTFSLHHFHLFTLLHNQSIPGLGWENFLFDQKYLIGWWRSRWAPNCHGTIASLSSIASSSFCVCLPLWGHRHCSPHRECTRTLLWGTCTRFRMCCRRRKCWTQPTRKLARSCTASWLWRWCCLRWLRTACQWWDRLALWGRWRDLHVPRRRSWSWEVRTACIATILSLLRKSQWSPMVKNHCLVDVIRKFNRPTLYQSHGFKILLSTLILLSTQKMFSIDVCPISIVIHRQSVSPSANGLCDTNFSSNIIT